MMEELNSLSSLSGLHRAQDTAELFLADLSQGKVGIERVLAWAFAFVVALVSSLWGQSKTELQELADKSEPATDAWMAEKARQFRWRHAAYPEVSGPYQIFIGADNIPTYDAEALADDAALIVQFSAAETNGGSCLVKVNGGSGGLPTALPTNQRDAVTYYLDRLQPPGAQVTVVSRVPDWLTIEATIYYNPELFDGLVGAVQNAPVEFLKKLPFNGVVSRDLLKDSIRNIPGVIDVVFAETKGRKSDKLPADPSAIVFIRQYKTFAGSCLFDLANSNLTFLPI